MPPSSLLILYIMIRNRYNFLTTDNRMIILITIGYKSSTSRTFIEKSWCMYSKTRNLILIRPLLEKEWHWKKVLRKAIKTILLRTKHTEFLNLEIFSVFWRKNRAFSVYTYVTKSLIKWTHLLFMVCCKYYLFNCTSSNKCIPCRIVRSSVTKKRDRETKWDRRFGT